MHKRLLAAAGVVFVAAMGAGAGPASAEPSTWLPDAILSCGGTILNPNEWVVIPTADTVWIDAGPLAGHYVILSHEHYLVDAYLEAAPTTYEGLPAAGAPRYFGEKTGLQENSIMCDFVSRWGAPDDPQAFSIVGPMLLSKVSG